MACIITIKVAEESLENLRNTIEQERKNLIQIEANIKRIENNASFLKTQIDTAKKLGKTSFDRDKLCVKKE